MHVRGGEDYSIIMHHAALVGDIVHEMLSLVIYLNPARQTEERLAEDHPHRVRAEKLESEV